MQLYEIEVENFRPFGSAALTLPLNGFVLVAGANNTGKTAFLSALDVAAGIQGDIASWRRAGSVNPARVAARFKLTDSDRQTLFSVSPQQEQLVSSSAAKTLELIFEERNGNVPRLAEVGGERPGGGMQPFVVVGRDQAGRYRPQVVSALIERNDQNSFLLRQVGPLYGGPMLLEDIERVPGMGQVRTLLQAWRSRYYHFRALRAGTHRSTQLKSEETLLPTGANLSAVLLNLRTDRSDRFEALRQLVAEIVPEIGDLQIRTGNDGMQVTFSMPGAELNLKDLGTGVEQLLLTLVVGLTASPPFLLVIEEPETNLHPAAQRALLGLFKDWAGDRQIVAATHSPVMLNWSPGGDRLWHVTRQQRESRIEPVREDPSPLLNSLGVRLCDVLSADRVLVVEGPSDEDVLETWFPEVLRNPNVAVLQGGGGDSARHADRFAEWLSGVDRIGLRRVLYLRDRDELSPVALERLEKSATVGVLARRELENYLLDPVALATVLGRMTRGSQPKPSPADIAAVMTEAADNLRRKIIVNRVCRQVEATQPLVGNVLRRQLACADSGQKEVTAAIMARFVTPDDMRAKITAAWTAAESDVSSRTAKELLLTAPGEEILNAVFQRFAGRGYSKRSDGVAIAKAMSTPPSEITGLLDDFMADA